MKDRAATQRSKRWRAFAALTGVWWLAALIVGPAGDFPVFDDWHYGMLVRSLLEEGQFALWDDISPNLFLQPFWGYLFCRIAGGFSFTCLRLSTLVLGWISMLFVFSLLHTRESQTRMAFWGAVAFAFCPMFFLLSFTFMTDIPFLAGCLGSLWAFDAFLRSGKARYRLIAYLFALSAYLMRLPGIFIIPAFELAAWISAVDKGRQWRWMAGGMLFIAFFFLLIETWIKPAVGLRSAMTTGASILSERHLRAPFDHLRMFNRNLLRGILITGFLALPLFPQLWKQSRIAFLRKAWIAPLLLATTGFIMALWRIGWIFPFVGEGSVIFNIGLGPYLLRDTYILGMETPPLLPPWTMIVLGWWATLAAILLSLLIFYRVKNNRTPFFLFLFFLNAAYMLFLSSYSYFDRYYLLPFASVLLLLLQSGTLPFPTRANYILIALGAWFSIAGTHDYLAWNGTVHQLADRLEQQGVRPMDIDGGMAYNGLKNEATENIDAPYAITFQPVAGYEVITQQDYYSWLLLRRRTIWVLRSGKRESSDRQKLSWSESNAHSPRQSLSREKRRKPERQ